MEPDFWLGRWARGETGWHQSEVEPGLIAHFSDLPPTRILVPLCGKSLDLVWLASKGHEVLGVELSELAVRSFFADNALQVQESILGRFKVFQSGQIKLFQGDFFDLQAELLAPIGAVYDRAALIALPPELRQKYAARLQALLQARATKSFTQLQIVLERTPHDEKGPPFSVRSSEIEALYGQMMVIEALSRETLEEKPEGKVEECIYRFRLKESSPH